MNNLFKKLFLVLPLLLFMTSCVEKVDCPPDIMKFSNETSTIEISHHAISPDTFNVTEYLADGKVVYYRGERPLRNRQKIVMSSIYDTNSGELKKMTPERTVLLYVNCDDSNREAYIVD